MVTSYNLQKPKQHCFLAYQTREFKLKKEKEKEEQSKQRCIAISLQSIIIYNESFNKSKKSRSMDTHVTTNFLPQQIPEQ